MILDDLPATILHQTLLGDAWDHADAGVVIFDDTRKFLAMNAAFCEMTGYTREEVATLHAGIDLAGNDDARQAFLSITAKGRRQGRAGMLRKDGSTAEVEYMVIPTKVSRLPFFIAVLWFHDEESAGAHDPESA